MKDSALYLEPNGLLLSQITIMILVSIIVYLGIVLFYSRRMLLEALIKLKQNLLIDLDLATSDQLLDEIRTRSLKYIFILPDDNNVVTNLGVKIEVHNLNPDMCIGLMQSATDYLLTQVQQNEE